MLLIALIVAYWVQRGAIDITSMVTGNPPPSRTYREAKKDNAEDGPLIRTLKGWWADAIEDIDEAKRRRRLDTKEEKDRERARRKAERQRVIDEAAEAERRERGETLDPEPVPDPEDYREPPPLPLPEMDESPEVFDETKGPRPWDPEYTDEGPRWWDRETEPVPGPEPEAVEERTVPDPEPETQAEPVPELNQKAAEEETAPVETEIFEGDVVEDEPKELDGPASETDGDYPGPMGPAIPELKVIQGGKADDTEWSVYGKPQLYAVQDQEGDKEMATTHVDGSGKVHGHLGAGNQATGTVAVEGGITTHINWTQAVADYQLTASNHVETVWASMFHGENGPERLAKISRIQEMHRQLRDAYLELNSILVADKNTVGEAYAATHNQAGGKAYTTT